MLPHRVRSRYPLHGCDGFPATGDGRGEFERCDQRCALKIVSEVFPGTHEACASISRGRSCILSRPLLHRPSGRVKQRWNQPQPPKKKGRNAAQKRKLGIIRSSFSEGIFSMQNTSMKRSAVFVAGALGLAGALFAGAAYAADPRLREANDAITNALVLLKAAENPDPKLEFGGHRKKAVEFLTRAQSEIAKAKEFADATSPTPPTKTPPTKTPKPPASK